MGITFDMSVTSEKLIPNMLSVGLILTGLIAAEKIVNQKMSFKSDKTFFAITGLLFFSGWAWFLYNDFTSSRNNPNTEETEKRKMITIITGSLIPIFAFIGQMLYYQTCVLKTKIPYHSILKMISMVGFIACWVVYLTFKSKNDTEFLPGCLLINFLGLGLLMMGMMWYFEVRKVCGTNILPIKPSVKNKYLGDMFNPSIMLITMGWVLLAIGNAAPPM